MLQAPDAPRARRSSDVVDFVAGESKAIPNAVFAGSVPYLMLAGNLMAGWQMARALLVAEDLLATGEDDAPSCDAKIATARFYAEHMLSKAPGDCATRSSKAPTSVTALAARRVLTAAARHRTRRQDHRCRCPPSCATCRCRSSARRCSSSATRSS